MTCATMSDVTPNTTYKLEVQTLLSRYSPEAEMGGSNISHVVVIMAYSFVIVISVAGNGIVMLSVVTCRRMRTVTNCHFIVNLAGADLMMAVFCVPFTFIANWLVDRWPFGAVMCPIVPYLQTVVVLLSAFTLVGLVAKTDLFYLVSLSVGILNQSPSDTVSATSQSDSGGVTKTRLPRDEEWSHLSPWLASASIVFVRLCFHYNLASLPAKFSPRSASCGCSPSSFHFRLPSIPASTP